VIASFRARRRARVRDGASRGLALVLAWGVAVIGLLAWAPASAQAADLGVGFTMTSLKVSGYRPDDQVTITGTVANTGGLPAYGVQAILWRSRDAIRDLPTLRTASTSTLLGSRLSISADHYVVVSTSLEAFATGQSQQITLHASIAELGFDTRGAAFAFGVDVIANADPSAEYRTVGQFRTFIPIPGTHKVPVTSIVVLSAPPTKLVDNLFRNDALATELTGRLSTLLDAAAQPGMSWLIDPALLDEVRDMADGYEVNTKDGTEAGTGQDAAKAWLDRYNALDRSVGGRTLFANPDLNGARAAGDTLVVSRAERAAAKVAGLEGLPVVAVPAAGVLAPATYDFLSGSGVDAVLTTNATQAGALQSAASGDRPRLLGASAAVPGAQGVATNLQRQFALATAVVAGTKGEARLLTSAADVEQDAAAMAGWLVRRSLGDLLRDDVAVGRATVTAAKPARLSSAQFDLVSRIESDFTTHAELAPDSTLPTQSDAAVSRAASSSWVQDSKGFDGQADGLADLVALPELGRSVTLDASPRFLMSSRTNQFPVTVTNNLAEAIRVKVVVNTDNPQRLTVPASDLVTVDPGQSVTVNIRPEATSNGLVTAHAHVATESGRRLTPVATSTVEVTALGVVAWIIVAVSGLVLVGATAWRIRQVRRRDASGSERTAA
jgi:hypothetical protein